MRWEFERRGQLTRVEVLQLEHRFLLRITQTGAAEIVERFEHICDLWTRQAELHSTMLDAGWKRRNVGLHATPDLTKPHA